MSLKIQDEKLGKSASGGMLRFSVFISADASDEFGMGVKGFLAFRNKDGGITVKPPVSYIAPAGKRIKYEGSWITPKLQAKLEEYVEKTHGKHIQADPDWNEVRKARKLLAKHEGFVL